MLNNTREEIFGALFALVTAPLLIVGTTHTNSNVVDGLANMNGLAYGGIIAGGNIPVNSRITSVNIPGKSVTISNAVPTGVVGTVLTYSPFVTTTRQTLDPSQVPQEKRPCLAQSETTEDWVQETTGRPGETTLNIVFIIYVWTKNVAGADIPPISLLNPRIDALQQALQPNFVTYKQTLGGLVNHCWIEGTITKVSGDLDGDSIALVPVKLLVPA